MRANILTIDWDYFFNAPLSVRAKGFPDNPNGALDYKPDNSVWLDCICPEITFDMVSYLKVLKAIEHSHFKMFSLSENHGEMYNIVKYLVNKKGINELTITNIDFHHDYSYSGSTPQCDNWFRLVDDIIPCKKRWCKREDSVTTTFGDEVPIEKVTFEQIMEELKRGEYDCIHLCRSDLYSPPISDSNFHTLGALLNLKSREIFSYKEKIEDRTQISISYKERLSEEMKNNG